MTFKKLCKTIQTELNRLVVYVGCATITFAFAKEAITKSLSWQDYPAYSASMIGLCFPYLAVKALRIWKGSPERNIEDEGDITK